MRRPRARAGWLRPPAVQPPPFAQDPRALRALQDSSERGDFSSNRHPALPLCLSMSFFAKPVPTFAGHALAHEHNADLAVIAPHDTTAPAQQQRELVGDLLVIRDGEPRAAVGDVPYDAAQRRRGAITIDLSEIMDFVSPAVSQLAQRIPRKQTHPVLLPWLQRAAACRQTRKIFIAPSVKPVSIAAIGIE